MPVDSINPSEWISAREAGRRLAIPHHNVRRVAKAAGIRRLVIPTRADRYHAGDVGAVCAAAVVGGPGPAARRKPVAP